MRKDEIKSSLSVILILGLVFKNMPLKLVQPFLSKAMFLMQKKHGSLFTRLADENLDFIIDAIDLPFLFYLKPNKINPILLAVKRSEKIYQVATIKGTLENLLKLFEGTLDGDAAFFSKELIIEGSTAATVALRNAIDGEDMKIVEDLSEIFSPFQETFKNIATVLTIKHNKIQAFIQNITDAVNYNNNKSITEQNMKISDIFEELDSIQDTLKMLSKEKIRRKSDYNPE